MNITQYFHKKETLPMFNIGDTVKLKKYPEDVRLLYNKYYPNCYVDRKKFIEIWNSLADRIGYQNHIVSKCIEGTPAAGGWFVFIDNEATGYHGNIFELVNK